MATKGGFAQDCYRIFEIDEPESVPDGKNLKKIRGKTVSPRVKVKVSTDVARCNKQKICEAFCLENYFVSYVGFTVCVLTL